MISYKGHSYLPVSSQADIADALEHADDFLPDDVHPTDFDISKTVMSIEDLDYYDDLSAWVEVDDDELKDATRQEVIDWAKGYRPGFGGTYEFSHTAAQVFDTGEIPPIVIVDTPSGTTIGDGRGRVNLAIALGLEEIPAIILTWKEK